MQQDIQTKSPLTLFINSPLRAFALRGHFLVKKTLSVLSGGISFHKKHLLKNYNIHDF